MKKIIIPVDFSECSLATAQYGIQMFAENPRVHLVVYYMYRDPDEEESAYQAFESIKYGLSADLVSRMAFHAELGQEFPKAICKFARHLTASLIVTCLSRSTLVIIEENPCPVMIVPSNIECHEIRTVALTSDFHDVAHHTPARSILDVLDMFHPALHIVNVNSEFYVALSEEYREQQQQLSDLFSDYEPEFDYLSLYDFQESIRMFVADKKIDLLITIPHHHTVVENLFRERHTRKLVLGSTVPVLAAHD